MSDETKGQVIALMSDINVLNLDYSKLKDTLNKASSKFVEDLKALGVHLESTGFFDKLFNWIQSLFDSIFG